jgi:hypothetical protein
MRWFRSRSKGVSCLALLGLALQLTLSFGHIHLKDVLSAGHSSTSIGAATITTSLEGTNAILTDREPLDHEDEYCAIYAINSLIGSAQGVEPPALSVPLLIVSIGFPTVHEFRLTQSDYILRRARAPPVA